MTPTDIVECVAESENGLPIARGLVVYSDTSDVKVNDRLTALENQSSFRWKHLRKNPFFYIALACLLVAIAAWLQPIYSAHKRKDFHSEIETEVQSELHDPIANIAKISNDVEEMKGTLKVLAPLIQGLILQRMKNSANAPLENFRATLPQIASTLQAAKTENVSAPPEVVSSLGSKFGSTETSAPSYWSAAFAFITYRSFSDMGEKIAWAELPPCEYIYSPNATIQVPKQNGVPGDESMPLRDMTASNCYMYLDNATVINTTFRNSLIIYRGRPVNLHNVTFENCIFNITTPEQVSPQGIEIGKKLLAASSTTIIISTS